MNELTGTNNWAASILKYSSQEGKYRGLAGTCLSSFLDGVRRSELKSEFVYYEFEFFKGLEYLGANKDDYCPFSFSEIIDTLDDIRKVIDFKFRVEERENTWDIALRVDRKYSSKQHLYILTRVRYLYEAPYSLFYRDAMNLKKIKDFEEYNLQDLYNLVISSLPITIVHIGDFTRYVYDPYHSIPSRCKSNEVIEMLDYDSLKENLWSDKYKYCRLNSLYKKILFPEKRVLDLNVTLIRSLAYWTMELKERVPVYLYNLYRGKREVEVNTTPTEILIDRLSKVKIDLPLDSVEKLRTSFNEKIKDPFRIIKIE